MLILLYSPSSTFFPTSSHNNCFIHQYDPASCKIKTCSLSGSCRIHLHCRLVTGSTETRALRDAAGERHVVGRALGWRSNLSPLPSKDIRRSLRLLSPLLPEGWQWCSPWIQVRGRSPRPGGRTSICNWYVTSVTFFGLSKLMYWKKMFTLHRRQNDISSFLLPPLTFL